MGSLAWDAHRRGEQTETTETDRHIGRAVARHSSVWPAAPTSSPLSRSIAKRTSGSFPRRGSLVVEFYRIADTVAVLAVLLAVILIGNSDQMTRGVQDFVRVRLTLTNVLLVGLFALAWRHAFLLFGLYELQSAGSWREEAGRVVAACSVGAAFALVLPLAANSGSFEVASVAYLWLGATATTLGLRFALRRLTAHAIVRSHAKQRKQVLIVGSGPLALRAYRRLCARGTGVELVGFVDTNNRIQPDEVKQRTIGTLEQLDRILMHRVVDEVLIALPIKSCYSAFQRAISVCEGIGVQAKYFADIFACSVARLSYESSGLGPVVALEVTENDSRLLVKRAIDLVGAAVLLALASPLMLAIAVGIKLTSPGPAIFGQERYGLQKRRFRMFKFRTMVTDAEALQPSLECMNEAEGPCFKIKNDPRVTPFGRFLRRTSLDELPQLVNVIRGEMSLVGPRPLPVRDVEHFAEPWPMRRFSVVPGLTCLWQTSGRCKLAFEHWVQLDLEYIDNWSLGLDFRILLRTIPAVLRGVGAA